MGVTLISHYLISTSLGTIAQLGDSIGKLFDTSDFVARWTCGNWSTFHGWFHILSDLAIASAYFIIPFALVSYWWVKRNELAFPKLFWLFSAFIFSCGSTHLVDAIIFYSPVYRLSGLLKFITGVVSWATVIALLRIAPKAFELPGLRKVNDQLQVQLELTRKAEQTLEKSNKDLQAFAGIVTHDLRNPVSSALFMAELARESAEAGDTRQTAAHLQTVVETIRHMDSLVTELHKQSMARNRDLPDMKVPLDEVIGDTLAHLDKMLTSTQAKVDHEALPEIRGNKVLLIQLFTNLIENALKYRSGETPQIHISSFSGASHHVISIKDNGRGIPVGEHERVFEPETRGDDVSGIPGSGLGLALCRRIMEEHHGTIRASAGEKGGSVFELRFPRFVPA